MKQRLGSGAILLTILSCLMMAADTPHAPSASGYTLVGWNNLGMHCMDSDFNVFAILPPYNTVAAQLVDPSGRLVKSTAGITVTYQAIADPGGSINRTSQGKTDFWRNTQALFGTILPFDMGLAGKMMPGAGNVPQAMTFDAAHNWFIAEGVPITPYDDSGAKNYYPLMRLVARNTAGTLLAQTDVVLPVSDEMSCSSCHSSGSSSAAQPRAGWVFDRDPVRDFRLNILRLHDRDLSSSSYASALVSAGYSRRGLYSTVVDNGKPILCASCHLSEALPGTGLPGVRPLTQSVHGMHAGTIDPTNGLTLESSANRSACYSCHPGSTTKCLRGAMGNAVATDGSMSMQCQSCHGAMSQVGAATRTGWLDEPTCQNCHTGTAVANNGQIRYSSVFESSGKLRVAVDRTFATNADMPAPGYSLYRFSTGHGGLQCEACHGSTHAEYPSSHRNDNIQSLQLQGHDGVVAECATCHGTRSMAPTGGPHGMHPMGQSWVSSHPDVAERNGSAQCQLCHGADYRGTVLSRAKADRNLSTKFGTKNYWRGFQVGCYSCHNGPSSSNSTSNHPPAVANASAVAVGGRQATIPLQSSDVDGNTLTLRIVSQPQHGTAGISGRSAVYYPDPTYAGVDSFTYAAWDGLTNSALGTVTVMVKKSFGYNMVQASSQATSRSSSGDGGL